MDHTTHSSARDLEARRFDPSASVEDNLCCALKYTVLAPSSHNTQPWRFLLDDDTVLVCADRLRALPVVDPFDRELIISCGAALLNLRVALSHFGMGYTIGTFPSDVDPDLIARVRIVQDGFRDPRLGALFAAIPDRVTTREPFGDDPLPDALLQRIVDAAATEGAQAVCVTSVAERALIADLIAEADRMQFADPRFRRELASWIHPRRRDDGMPAYGARVSGLLDFATPVVASVIRTFDVGGGMAAVHQRLVEGSPVLIGIGTESDDRDAWLAAGQALERVLLTAADTGYTASYLNQPIEVDALRLRLRTLLRMTGEPQLLIRVGRGPAVPHAPRRPLRDVIS
ncbi:nitroreductase [Burkholderia sp. lig30]|jgi:hypothetical protein|uniref:Acg family FMN-binding oxidoreductase n=1 Tax=Burkholderia sp. lig30 TaxID=1192124 RepID=UPI000461106D|nr:nitroreductase family protein [Burkholderia sp. lig30]KDB06467.1 nitroreductase [Burkholderia sp. lig30]